MQVRFIGILYLFRCSISNLPTLQDGHQYPCRPHFFLQANPKVEGPSPMYGVMGSSHLPLQGHRRLLRNHSMLWGLGPHPLAASCSESSVERHIAPGCQWGNQAAAARGRFREVGRFGLLAALMGAWIVFLGGGGNFHSYACSQSPSLLRFRNLQNRKKVSKNLGSGNAKRSKTAKNNAIKKASKNLKNTSHFFLHFPRVLSQFKNECEN